MISSPTREDPLVRAGSSWLGGPAGVHARVGRSRWIPLGALVVAVFAAFAVGVLQKSPCESAQWPRDSNVPFVHMCYTDVPYLYRERGFADGNLAYIDSGDYRPLEYPVLTGAVMQVAASVTHAFGTGDAAADSVLFYRLTVPILFCLALVVAWATRQLARGRPYDAMMVAAAPTLALAGTINWDLLAVALSTLALLAWSRSRPVGAGVLIGLGAAAKFFPLLLLGPLLVLAVRTGKLRHWATTLVSAAAAWLAVNLPILLVAPDAWSAFWSYNTDRQADFGSPWYVLGLSGHPLEHVNAVSLALFALACVGIAALALGAPRRPRLAQLAFLTIAAFLLVNKVYSPQYALWLLPLVALARPRWRDWVVWQGGEVLYWGAVWLHIGGQLTPAAGGSDPLYWIAVGIRLATTGYLCALVVRDILRPASDVVRRGGRADDPAGGPFDGAPTVSWLRRAGSRRLPGPAS